MSTARKTILRAALIALCILYIGSDTFSFQALDFYKKHGYVVFAKLNDIPPGHSRYYLKKLLEHADRPAATSG
jgi:hypothetical protein